MKKFLLLITILFLLVPQGLCEDFPPRGGRDEYPIYWYLHDYAEALMKTFTQSTKRRIYLFSGGIDVEHIVKLTRDGQVIPQRVSVSGGKHNDELTKKVILSTPLKPFSDDIELDEMIIEICLEYGGWGDIVYVVQKVIPNSEEKIYRLFIQKEP